MGFDADAFLAAREPWTLTLGGRAYTARPLSVPQVLAFQQAMETAGADEAKQATAVAVLLRQMFPPRWAYVWRDPVRLIQALPSDVQAEVLKDFFEYLARTLSQSPKTTTPPSTPLSAPTPPPSPAAAVVEGVPV